MGLLDRISTPSARTESRINGLILLASCLLCVPGLTIWRQSVMFLVFISLWTAVRTDMAVWVASRVKAKQEEKAMTQTDPRDPDFDPDTDVRDPDSEQADQVRDPAEPTRNPDEPEE